jgi:5'-3' exonuclease
MNKYLIIDTPNLFFRSRHSAHKRADIWTKLGLALHVTLMSANKMARKFDADHVIFTLEGRSWRKDFYEPYKKNRSVARAALSEAEQEEEKLFWETYEKLTDFLRDKTNCSVIRSENAEGDDVIARWIALHPQDQHVIVSSDSDFIQLLDDNVQQYDGIKDHLITLDGIFDDKGNPVIDNKTKEPKKIPDPAWALFEKCIRGDTSDNVFSAYPGVKTKGTTKKVGLLEAFEDRDKKGYNWNNLMLHKWVDHNGVEHRVLDDYERNRHLIDLNAQPDEIKIAVDTAIREQVSHKDVGQVGIRFLQFCGKYDLMKASEQASQFGSWMTKTYKGNLHV